MTIGIRIKTSRKAQGLSQKELAKKLGVAQSLIAYLEVGDGKGSSHIASIAHALNVNAHWLETGEGQEKPESVEIEKKYCKEIEYVISLMTSTDERGREKAILAVKDALDSHHAWKNSLPRPNDIVNTADLATRLAQDLLPEILENVKNTNDVYKPAKTSARKDKRY